MDEPPRFPRLAGRFPFRLGTTSYVLPADILPNVEALAGVVDDVELVLFHGPEASNLLDAAVRSRLAELAIAHRLSWTVHLPLDRPLGAADPAQRQRALDGCLTAIACTRDLAPFAYVVHWDWMPDYELGRWHDALRSSMRQLLAEGFPASSFCVENLGYPYAMIGDLVAELGCSACIDLGHLLVRGYNWRRHLEAWWPRCRVIHAHGVEDDDDHRGLDKLDAAVFDEVLRRLSRADAERVLTVEVFGVSELAASLAVLEGSVP